MNGSSGTLSAYVLAALSQRLDRHRVVVWYDGEDAFSKLLTECKDTLAARGVAVVSAAGSRLRARRQADEYYRRLGESGAPVSLLLYVPTTRGSDDQARQADSFEALARVGDIFGDNEGERLRALAHAALPGRAATLDRLFAAGTPSLATLDALAAAEGAHYPLIKQALGSDDPVEVLARVLAERTAEARLHSVPGSSGELARLVESSLGFPPTASQPWSAFRERLAAFLLIGELASERSLPASLAGVPHVQGRARAVSDAVLAGLRERDAGREAYVQLARAVETRYSIAAALAGEMATGRRDTFPIQDRIRVRRICRLAATDLPSARSAFDAAADSLWRREEERVRIWAATQRCLEFLEIAANWVPPANGAARSVRGLVAWYAAPDGAWRLDRAQRLFEQALAECAHDEEVEPLAALCRERYRALVDRAQEAFQAAVRTSGWPPDGVLRQTRTYDERVAPELANRTRVAYVLVDSLRFELGQDLGAALAGLGTAVVEPAAAALPTITPNGMAALLPGADGTLRLVPHGGELVPSLGETPLPGLKERQALLRARLGDRYADLELTELLGITPRRLAQRFGEVDLLVVRSLDIDDLGEGRSAFNARKWIGGAVGELKTATERLAAVGFSFFVFAADHGHMLVHELPAGDVVPVPDGEWLLKKRRALIGKHRGAIAGVALMPAIQAGIQSEIGGLEYAAASGFKTFRADESYFHEGLSLQECLIPVVTLRAKSVPAPAVGGEQVTISYRSDEFRGSMIGLKVRLMAMLVTTMVVRIEAFDGPGPRAKRVGEAGECDARDPVTGEVTLRAGEEVQVPLGIDFDFAGPSIEVRATDPLTGVVYSTMQLRNGRLE